MATGSKHLVDLVHKRALYAWHVMNSYPLIFEARDERTPNSLSDKSPLVPRVLCPDPKNITKRVTWVDLLLDLYYSEKYEMI